MYIYICKYVYMYIYIDIHTYICLNIYIYVSVYIYIYQQSQIRRLGLLSRKSLMYIYVYVCMYVCIYYISRCLIRQIEVLFATKEPCISEKEPPYLHQNAVLPEKQPRRNVSAAGTWHYRGEKNSISSMKREP